MVSPSGESIRQNTNITPDDVLALDVSINRAVVAPVVGLSYAQRAEPYAPLDLFLRMLRFVPRAILSLMVVVALILIISKVSFNLRDVAVIQAIFWLHALVLMILGQYFEDPKALMLSTSFLTATLVYFAIRSLNWDRFLVISSLCWVVVLLGVYPLSGEVVSTFPFNQYDNLTLLAILIFTFSYLLWTRINSRIELD